MLLVAFFATALTAQAVAAPLKILALGDSLIHGYGLPAGQTFPEQLEAALKAEGHDVVVLNDGNSGDTTAAGLARLDWALADKPDLVLVEFGGNDGLRGIGPADTRANMDAMIARLTAEGLPVLLAGMLAPRNLGAEYAREFDAVFP
ncbi:MAG: GDSL-type esterase/lipase family protein, partial [Kiloniellales bacterium]|nr:GDSL-type esterase/lipase family protein [Kiloniellales bacterium]